MGCLYIVYYLDQHRGSSLIAESIGAVGGFAIVAGFYLLLGFLFLHLEMQSCEKLQENCSNYEEKEKIIMELIESNDAKSVLLKKSERHKTRIEEEVNLFLRRRKNNH